MIKRFRNIALLFVLLIVVLGNSYASNFVHDATRLNIEKSAISGEIINVRENLTNIVFENVVKCSDDGLEISSSATKVTIRKGGVKNSSQLLSQIRL